MTRLNGFDKAAAWLALQPRTEAEVRAYLRKKEYSSSEIDDAVGKLLEYAYLDDCAYAQNYIRQAAFRGKGRRKIDQELAGKGISREIQEDAWSQLEDAVQADGAEADPEARLFFDEKKRALGIAVKMTRQHLSDGKELDEKFLARVGRRLSGQGYSADVVYFAVNKLRGLKP